MADRNKREADIVVQDIVVQAQLQTTCPYFHVHTHTQTQSYINMHIHIHRLVSRLQDTPNRDGRVLWQIEMPADDKVGMDWLLCPCHVAPSAPNREEDRWIPRLKAGWHRETGTGRQTMINEKYIR